MPLDSAILPILDSHWDSSRIVHCCPVSLRFCSFDFCRADPFMDSKIHRWGKCWGRPTQSTGCGPGWCLSCSACQLSYAHATKASSPVLPRKDMGPALQWWHHLGQISYVQVTRPSSTMLPRQGSALIPAVLRQQNIRPVYLLLWPRDQHSPGARLAFVPEYHKRRCVTGSVEPSNINMAPGISPEQRHLHGLWW